MTIEVLRPGMLSTLQDRGRFGYQRYGVVVDGAMDELSHRVANLLVGNDPDEATLELTLQGPDLLFAQECVIALAGAAMEMKTQGAHIPMYRPAWIGAGTRVGFGTARVGCRAYLAVAGGFAAAPVLGSRSTYLPGAIGGHEGRALRRGDVLSIGANASERVATLGKAIASGRRSFAAARWFVASPVDLHAAAPIRVVRGRGWKIFGADGRRAFLASEFRISAQSDRMGYRLEGAESALAHRMDLISEATSFGSVQVPPDGRPIVLMADRQTTGGYPKIAEVIGADLPRLAQRRPGEVIRFETIALDPAQALLLEQDAALRRLGESVRAGWNS